MRVIFMGSPECACPILEALTGLSDVTVVAVVAQPDRPQGRGLHLHPCPVKACAASRGLSVLTPPRVNQPEVVAALAALRPDVIVVAAFGQILRAPLLGLAPLGCVNVHGSLLPRYRGAAPAQWAIARGETVTGVTMMRMDAGLDTGAILLKREVPIDPDDTGGTLLLKLARAGAALLPATLAGLAAGTLAGEPQDDRAATLAPKLAKADGVLDWRRPASELALRIRAFHPWPCCFCEAPAGSGAVLRVLKGVTEKGTGCPGEILALDGDGPLVAAGGGALRLLEVQPAGRTIMSGAAYARGCRLTTGVRFG